MWRLDNCSCLHKGDDSISGYLEKALIMAGQACNGATNPNQKAAALKLTGDVLAFHATFIGCGVDYRWNSPPGIKCAEHTKFTADVRKVSSTMWWKQEHFRFPSVPSFCSFDC